MYNFMIYFPIWKKALLLAWPVITNHIFTTLMRTTDMLLMGYFGPAAVTAVGLGDVWERIVLRIGLGFGSGSISLISQESGLVDIGEQANEKRDEILTQVLLMGIISGLPFMAIGIFIPDKLIKVLGAAPDVVVLGAQYLLIIFLAAPFRVISLISARALQGTGNTRIPMIIDIISNIVNIFLSVVLALGIGIFPELGVPGVGWGTFTAKLLAAIIYFIVFLLPRSPLRIRFPWPDWDLTITTQLLKVSIPRGLQGGYQSLITFPFNSLILVFGTEAAAAYHIARRIQQQLLAPLQRSLGTVTTIMTGQKLGQGQPVQSREITRALLRLTILTIGLLSLLLFVFAPQAVSLFSGDPETLSFGVLFLRALSIGAPLLTITHVISGLLEGAGDTRTPFMGLVFSQTFFKLGLGFLLSISLELGLLGILIGLVVDYFAQMLWVLREYFSLKWARKAQKMINERQKQ